MDNVILRETVGMIVDAFGSDLEMIKIERAVFGLFFSGVKLSTGHGGVCYTPVKEMPEAVCCPSSARAMPLSGRLKGRTAAESALKQSGKFIPWQVVTISRDGKILD